MKREFRYRAEIVEELSEKFKKSIDLYELSNEELANVIRKISIGFPFAIFGYTRGKNDENIMELYKDVMDSLIQQIVNQRLMENNKEEKWEK